MVHIPFRYMNCFSLDAIFVSRFSFNQPWMHGAPLSYNYTIPLVLTQRTFVCVSKNIYIEKKGKSKISRNSMILPQHVGYVFLVHNGKTYISVHISHKMLGHKLGEFASTRKKPNHIKKKK